ncbi:MAG: NAD(+) synthase, partial [Alphaproteobacteria bacterium]|nr:NAD(+) synthase [Alphaproteobacteria bacterium]
MTNLLAIDAPAAIDRICAALASGCRGLNRRGAVLGISGGVDSAVCAALAVRALGAERVLGVLMPEKDCPDDGAQRAMRLCAQLGIETLREDITAPLEALRCYGRRDDAMR